MIRDCEYLFETTLHQKLKGKVVGKVFVKVTRNDELLVKIESYGNLKFSLTFDNFSERIINGWSTDYAEYEILKQYKSFILGKYFM